MAVDYKVIEKDGKFHIEERATEYIIRSFNTRIGLFARRIALKS